MSALVFWDVAFKLYSGKPTIANSFHHKKLVDKSVKIPYDMP